MHIVDIFLLTSVWYVLQKKSIAILAKEHIIFHGYIILSSTTAKDAL